MNMTCTLEYDIIHKVCSKNSCRFIEYERNEDKKKIKNFLHTVYVCLRMFTSSLLYTSSCTLLYGWFNIRSALRGIPMKFANCIFGVEKERKKRIYMRKKKKRKIVGTFKFIHHSLVWWEEWWITEVKRRNFAGTSAFRESDFVNGKKGKKRQKWSWESEIEMANQLIVLGNLGGEAVLLESAQSLNV